MDVEEVLTQALADRGVEVERGVELAGVRDGGTNVRAVLRSGAVTDEGCFDFVAGCDGPASTVRAQAGMFRQYEGFAAVVPVPGDAPAFDRALGLSGRDPHWKPR